jgi:D-alanyl-D-alanine carboxypeptidase
VTTKNKVLAAAGLLLLLAAAAIAGPFRQEFRRGWYLRTQFDEVAPGVHLRSAASDEERASILAALDEGRARADAWIGGLRHSAKIIVVDDQQLHASLGLSNRFVQNNDAEPGVLYVGPRGVAADLIAHGHLHAELKHRLGVERWRQMPTWFDEGVCTQVDLRPFLHPAAVDAAAEDDLSAYATHLAFTGPAGEDALIVAKRAVQAWLACAGGPSAVSTLLEAYAAGEEFDAVWERLQRDGRAREQAAAERVRAVYEERRAQQGFPGLLVGWSGADGRRGGVVVVGVRERGGDDPLRPEDRMLWGSVGKTFVAAVVLQLAAEGALGLDDPLARHLGELAGYARLPNAESVTLRQLLLHRSGIPDHVRKTAVWEAVRADPDKIWSAAELIAWAYDDAPLAPPGAAFGYADTNYVLLGAVAERIENRGLFDSVRERLLLPWNLRGAAASDRRELPGLVQGHPVMLAEEWGIPARTLSDGKFFMNPQFEHGGGGMYGTADALARWITLLHAGPVLTAELRAERLRGEPVAEGAQERYGYAAQLWPSPHGEAAGHGGWYPGYRTETAWFAELGLSAAVIVNTDAPQEARALRRLLLDGVDALLASAAEPPR